MIVRRIARPMLASMFISGGLNSLRDPGYRGAAAEKIKAHDNPVARALHITSGDEAVRFNGAVHLGAGLMLATGKAPRLAALALAATLAPTTAAGHRFWEEQDPKARTNQQVHFLKNVSMLGGLLLAAVDTGGRDSAARRARRAGRETARRAARQGRRAARAAREQLPA